MTKRKTKSRVAPLSRSVSATDAARNFSELVNQVHYRGESVEVLRGGKAVCRIVPAAPSSFRLSELVQWLSGGPKPDAEFLDELQERTRKQPKVSGSPWES